MAIDLDARTVEVRDLDSRRHRHARLRPAHDRHRGPADRARLARRRPAPRLGRPHPARRRPPRRAGRRLRRRPRSSWSAAATSASRWPRRSSPAGRQVTIVDIAPTLLRNLDPDMSERVAEAARRLGIELPPRRARRGHHRRPSVVDGRGASCPPTSSCSPSGVTPNTELAADAGLATGVRDAIPVDDHQRTSAEGVYSAGDCAESFHRVTGRPTWIALGHGGQQGGAGRRRQPRRRRRRLPGRARHRHHPAGRHRDRPHRPDRGRGHRGRLRPGRPRASRRRPGPATSPAPPTSRCSWCTTGARGRLLGGQIVGGAGAGKRIDTVATALWAGLTVDELVDLDLAYAPPFSPVWDPVQHRRPPGRQPLSRGRRRRGQPVRLRQCRSSRRNTEGTFGQQRVDILSRTLRSAGAGADGDCEGDTT